MTRVVAWVVYRMTVHGKPGDVSAVCEQAEWEAMERDRPGHHVLVRSGIGSEPEAEALARQCSGYLPPAARTGGASKSKGAKRAAACTPLLSPAALAKRPTATGQFAAT